MSEVKEELIEIEKLNPEVVFKTGGMKPVLEIIEKEVMSFIPDAETAKGRAEIKSLAYKIAQTKTALDKAGKGLSDKLNAIIKPINVERNLAKETLTELQTKVRKPLTDFEGKEKIADDQLKVKVSKITFSEEMNFKNSDDLKDDLHYVESISIDESFGKYEREARENKVEFIQKVSELIPLKEKQEQDEIELVKLRKESEERQAKENEDRIRKEEQEKAKEALEAQEIRLKAEAENKIDLEKSQEKARKANTEHQRKINNEALGCLINIGVQKDQAMIIIKAIAINQIKNIKIQY